VVEKGTCRLRSVDSKDIDSVSAAHRAGLIYVSSEAPGIRRIAVERGFRYVNPDGSNVRDEQVLRRISSLVIPPAWRSVWICPLDRGHLQATGKDARRRKQYRYHPRYRAERELKKYNELTAFGEVLPQVRKQVRRDLEMRGLPRSRVLAAIVSLLDLTSMRVGNEEYARDNRSYGLTTLRNRHAHVQGDKIRLRFRGKSGVVHSLQLNDRRLALVVKRCHDLPGYDLFQYVDESAEMHPIDSSMVNEYLKAISGRDITAKDFRTWHGTVEAATQLIDCDAATGERELTRNLVRAVEMVAKHLGNRPATCRKYYIHPAILDAYSLGTLGNAMGSKTPARRTRHLTSVEHSVLGFLRDYESKQSRALSRKRPRGSEAA
jgi:DNA topoisomerase I